MLKVYFFILNMMNIMKVGPTEKLFLELFLYAFGCDFGLKLTFYPLFS